MVRFFIKRTSTFIIAFLMLFALTASIAAQTNRVVSGQSKNTKKENISKTILFFGDSLTAGFGLSKKQAFPHLIQVKIDSLGWPYEVINAGLSGETSAGGLRRINWLLRRKIDILVLELGGNDALRGIDLAVTYRNLQGIVEKATSKYPGIMIVIAGMQVPPNFGKEYAGQFRQLFPTLAKKNHAVLIPFLLKDVGGNTKLNQPDGIHPTAQGHRIVAQTVWEVMETLLRP